MSSKKAINARKVNLTEKVSVKSEARRMNPDSLSDDELVELFERKFLEEVASYNNITEFEVTCRRKVGNNELEVDVTIYGFAGTPPLEGFCASDKSKTVVIDRFDKGELTLELYRERCTILNSNDYLVVYKSV